MISQGVTPVANGTIKISEWEDVTSAFTPVTGVTNFVAFYNSRLNTVWFYGVSPSTFATGNTLATIPSVYAGENRIHSVGSLYGGDGNCAEFIVQGTNLWVRARGTTMNFSSSFTFYGMYQVA